MWDQAAHSQTPVVVLPPTAVRPISKRQVVRGLSTSRQECNADEGAIASAIMVTRAQN